MKKKKELNFEGQSFFIGMDVHLNSWTITIRFNGLELKHMSIDPNTKLLHEYMNKHYPGGNYFTAYEAGYCGFWIHRELEMLGFKNIVIHPADVPTTDKERVSKTDSRDSRKIARELEKGYLVPIFVPSCESESIKNLCRLHERYIAQKTAVKQRLKGLLARLGITIPYKMVSRKWTKKFLAWLRDTASQKEGPISDYILYCLDSLAYNTEKAEEILLKIKKHISTQHSHTFNNLLSVPGIGVKTAIVLISEIEDMNRFRNLNRLCAYAGIAPGTRSSGEKDILTGLTRRKNKRLKHVIIEAAWVAIKRDPAMLSAYQQLTLRMKGTQAIIRIAKKLLARIRHIWITGEEYKLATV